MKNVIKVLAESSIWNYAIQLVSLAGLVFSNDTKAMIVFGTMYLGACFREKSNK